MKLIQEVEELIESGEYEEALTILNSILKEDPDNITALKIKAEIFYIQNQLALSLELYMQILHLVKDRLPTKEKGDIYELYETYTSIGRIHYLMNNFQTSTQYYGNALNTFNKLDSKSQTQLFESKLFLLDTMADVQKQLKNYSEARKLYHKVLQLHNRHGNLYGRAEVLSDIADMDFKLKKYSKSLKSYKEALRIYKKSRKVAESGVCHYNIGKIYYIMNNTQNSLTHLNNSVSLFEKFYEAHSNGNFMKLSEDYFYKGAKKLIKKIQSSGKK